MSFGRYCKTDLPDVVVSITLFFSFKRSPICVASFWKVLQKKYASSCGMMQFRSSTYANRFVIPPLLSSPVILFLSLVAALFLSILSIG